MAIPQSVRRVNLDSLTLSFLDFNKFTFLLREINVLNLEILRIKCCLDEDPLLGAIACVFEKGRPKLKYFELGLAGKVRNDYGTQAISDAVDKFLCAFSGLEVFHLDIDYLYEPPLLKSILRHANTLKSLSVSAKERNNKIPSEDVATILTMCLTLEELGTTLDPGHLDN
jgi:hypothetical protein